MVKADLTLWRGCSCTMVGDVVVGGSYSTGKNVTWNFDTFDREGKRRGKVTFCVDVNTGTIATIHRIIHNEQNY